MRNLIYIPSIHSLDETHDGAKKALSLAMQQKWKRTTDAMWDTVETRLIRSGIKFSGVKMFTEEISEFIAPPLLTLPFPIALNTARKDIGSDCDKRQMVLTRALLLAGGAMYPTDHTGAYSQSSSILTKFSAGSKKRQKQTEDEFLRKIDEQTKRRNKHIAETVNRNLYDGDTGILLVGYFHDDVIKMLDHDICIDNKNPEAERIATELILLQDEKKSGEGSLYQRIFKER